MTEIFLKKQYGWKKEGYRGSSNGKLQFNFKNRIHEKIAGRSQFFLIFMELRKILVKSFIKYWNAVTLR